MILIRPAQKEDIPEIFEIEKLAYAHLAWKESAFQAELDPRISIFFCGVRSSEIVAYCIARIHRDLIHLINIAVTPKNQENGIGTQLLDYLIIQAEALKKNRIELEVRANSKAVEFYQGFGFEILEKNESLYTNGSQKERAGIRMSLVLSKISV